MIRFLYSLPFSLHIETILRAAVSRNFRLFLPQRDQELFTVRSNYINYVQRRFSIY